MSAPPRTTFVTRGEPDAADAMRQRIGRNLQWNVRVPEQGECAALSVACLGRGKSHKLWM